MDAIVDDRFEEGAEVLFEPDQDILKGLGLSSVKVF